jgi:hypothetical protein
MLTEGSRCGSGEEQSENNENLRNPGTDVMIFKIFSPKKLRKLAFLTRKKAKLCKNFDHNIGF